MVTNLSYIVPKLIRWGEPPGGLQVDHVRLESMAAGMAAVDGNTLNDLLPLPFGAEQSLFAPDGHLMDIQPWLHGCMSPGQFLLPSIDTTDSALFAGYSVEASSISSLNTEVQPVYMPPMVSG